MAEEPSFADLADALSLGLPFRVRTPGGESPSRFVHVGARCEAMLGVPAEALLRDAGAFLDLVIADDRQRLLAEAADARDRGAPLSVDLRMRDSSGEIRWRNIRAAPRPLPDGGYAWDGLMLDITEARRLAEQLEAERRRLEEAIELAGMGVFQWRRSEPDSLIWSDHQYEIYGIKPGTPMSVERIISMIHPDDAEAVAKARTAALQGPGGGDFSYEYRIVRPTGEVRWIQQHQRIEHDGRGARWVQGATLDVTERRNAEENRRLQMRELAHRSKNALAVLAAMVHQAGRDAVSAEALVEVLMARIEAMARSQELATASEGRPLSAAVLVRQALGVFDLSRFDFDPALDGVTVPGDAVVGMALLLHELGTNAVKYGALSNPEGRVTVRRGEAPEGRVALEWLEAGGPRVSPPARQGFGTRLLAAVLQSVGGRVSPEFAPAGFRAWIELRST